MDWKQHIDCRVLIAERFSRNYTEVTVAEVSPAGRVKLRWPNGCERWEDADAYRLVEVLSNPRKQMTDFLSA